MLFKTSNLNNTFFQKNKFVIKTKLKIIIITQFNKHKQNKKKMTQLQILTQFNQLFNEVRNSLNNYNENLRNELFEIEPNEDYDQSYRKGEIIFDQYEDDIRNLNEIIIKQNEINKFFKKCRDNKQKLIKQKNEIINKLLRIKQNDINITRDEYLNIREFWNDKREETKDERNRRECEEMLEDIEEEKKNVEEMRNKMMNEKNELFEMKNDLEKVIEKAKKEKKELNVNEEFEKIAGEYLKKNDLENHFPKTEYEMLTKHQQQQLEEWTSLKCGEIIFDSNVDDWSQETTVFAKRIIGKKQLVFLIEDEVGEIFGYYLNTEIIVKYDYWQKTDSKSFEFILQSKNNRLKQPMKFEIKKLKKGGIFLCDKSDYDLIWLGEIVLRKENNKNLSFCCQNEDRFDYHGFEKALCGKIYPKNFTLKRILVIQMK